MKRVKFPAYVQYLSHGSKNIFLTQVIIIGNYNTSQVIDTCSWANW